MKKTNPNFQNGVPELLILQLLSRKEMYGYELVKAIQVETESILTYGEGCIYPVLHYLEKARWVSCWRQTVEGRSRLYYRITPGGLKRMESLSNDWCQMVKAVSLVMAEKSA